MQDVTTIEAHTSWDNLSKEWKALEETCRCSGYQTRRWIEPWLRTVGRAHGLSPLFILARDVSNSPVALFALTTRVRAGVRIASYAGGRDSNANMPLVRSDLTLEAPAIRRILTEGARAAGVDAYILLNQAHEWRGATNPLGALPGQPSTSSLHSTRLTCKPDRIIEDMPAEARKRLRWRTRKLEELGTLSLLHARTPEEVRAVADSFRRNKKVRIDAIGAAADFDVDLAASFLEEAALADDPGVELHALVAGEHIAAMYGGVVHAGRYHAMVNSYDVSPEIARTSPIELITIKLLQSLCERGIREFDLGIGDAPYKARWCDRVEPLFDTFLGVTAKGKAYAQAHRLKQFAKREVKRSEWLWPLAQKVRAKIKL